MARTIQIYQKNLVEPILGDEDELRQQTSAESKEMTLKKKTQISRASKKMWKYKPKNDWNKYNGCYENHDGKDRFWYLNMYTWT